MFRETFPITNSRPYESSQEIAVIGSKTERACQTGGYAATFRLSSL